MSDNPFDGMSADKRAEVAEIISLALAWVRRHPEMALVQGPYGWEMVCAHAAAELDARQDESAA